MMDKLLQYIDDHLEHPNPVLAELEEAYRNDDAEAGPPHIGKQVGAFLRWIIHGDAGELLDRLEGPCDLILQDAAKALYPEMLERCVDRIRTGGVLAADDALFRPMGVREELARVIDEYNRMVFDHPRLISTILPIGDGLTISVKRP